MEAQVERLVDKAWDKFEKTPADKRLRTSTLCLPELSRELREALMRLISQSSELHRPKLFPPNPMQDAPLTLQQ